MEVRRFDVSLVPLRRNSPNGPTELQKAGGADPILFNSYNRYLAIAARTVRRSLKEDKRVAAERRGESDLRFARWSVSAHGLGAEAYAAVSRS